MALMSRRVKYVAKISCFGLCHRHTLHHNFIKLCSNLCFLNDKQSESNQASVTCKSVACLPVKHPLSKIDEQLDLANKQTELIESVIGSCVDGGNAFTVSNPKHHDVDAHAVKVCKLRDSKPRMKYRKSPRFPRSLHFAKGISGLRHHHEADANTPLLNVYTDASGRWGLGCIWDQKWIVSKWDQSWLSGYKTSMELLEMKAIHVAILTWGHAWVGCRVRFHCDNMMVVAYFNERAKPNRKYWELVKSIKLAASKFQFDLVLERADKSAIMFQGTDSLSKMDVGRFKKLLPNMNPVPDLPPTDLEYLLPDEWESICVSLRLRTVPHQK